MPRHSQLSHTRMTPADRRREVVAILSHGLCRMHDREGLRAEENSRPASEPACFTRRKAAQCVSNTHGSLLTESGFVANENDEEAR